MPTYWNRIIRKRAIALGFGLLLSTLSVPHALATSPAKVPDTRGLAPDFRLEIIGFRIATSNSNACAAPKMLTGMMLQDEGGFSAAIRADAKRWHGLGSGFGITRIVPGSPAALAGLNHGDEILAMNGMDLTRFARDLVKRKASYARTERFIEMLEAQLQQGPVTLRVKQHGEERDIALTGTPGCGGYTVLVDSNEFNAWSDGRYIAVTTRMVSFTASDDELAFVVAHEMAHNNLQHSGRFGKGKLILAEFGFGSGKVRKAELAADELAIEMLASAGYDLDASESLLMRSGKHRGPNLSLSHPGTNRRITGARLTRNQLVIRQTARDLPAPQPHQEAQATVAIALVLLPPAELPIGQQPQVASLTLDNPTRNRQFAVTDEGQTAMAGIPPSGLALAEGLAR